MGDLEQSVSVYFWRIYERALAEQVRNTIKK